MTDIRKAAITMREPMFVYVTSAEFEEMRQLAFRVEDDPSLRFEALDRLAKLTEKNGGTFAHDRAIDGDPIRLTVIGPFAADAPREFPIGIRRDSTPPPADG